MYTPTSFASPTYSSFKGLKVSRNITMETAAESPIQVRAKSVEKRFNKMQASIEAEEAQTRIEQMEANIRLVDERITKNYKDNEHKLKTLNKHIEQLEEDVAAEIIARELLEERSIKELIVVESNLVLELQTEREQNKESQKILSSLIEEKIHTVLHDCSIEQTRMSTFKDEQLNLISEQMSELHQDFEKEQFMREKVHDTIIRTMNNQVNKMRETLEIERKVRVETEEYLSTKIEEISSSLKRQVSSEREKQERDEAHLLVLLEEICNRFEDQFVTYYQRK